MEEPPVPWNCPERINEAHMDDSLAVRKARAIGMKLSHMPTDLWDGQLLGVQ